MREVHSQLPKEVGQEGESINIYKNISRPGLHKIVAGPAILPYVEIIALLVWQVNVTNRRLRDIREKPLATYQLPKLDKQYMLLKLECHSNSHWLNDARDQIDIPVILNHGPIKVKSQGYQTMGVIRHHISSIPFKWQILSFVDYMMKKMWAS